MSYERTFWENGKTPINADNLNKLEEGVSANAEALFAVNENMSALTEEVGTKAEQTDLEALGTDLENVENNVGTLENRVSALELSGGGGGGGELPTGLLTVSDIKPNLNGNETDKMPSVSAVKTAIEVAKEEVLENIPSGGDEATVRYVSNEADENFGWVQYLDANGTWVNWEQAVMTNYPLYMSSANEGGFALYQTHINNGTTYSELTFADKMTLKHKRGGVSITKAYSECVDITRYSTLYFDYSTQISGSTGGYSYVLLVVDKNKHNSAYKSANDYNLQADTMLSYQLLPFNSASKSQNGVQIDVSNIIGECYVGIVILSNVDSGISADISNMYLE